MLRVDGPLAARARDRRAPAPRARHAQGAATAFLDAAAQRAEGRSGRLLRLALASRLRPGRGTSDPENDPQRTRWSWSFAIRPLLLVGDLREAPPVEAAGVFPRSLGRHSYVRLTEKQLEAAIDALQRNDADGAFLP
jgi:hypothetical protein